MTIREMFLRDMETKRNRLATLICNVLDADRADALEVSLELQVGDDADVFFNKLTVTLTPRDTDALNYFKNHSVHDVFTVYNSVTNRMGYLNDQTGEPKAYFEIVDVTSAELYRYVCTDARVNEAEDVVYTFDLELSESIRVEATEETEYEKFFKNYKASREAEAYRFEQAKKYLTERYGHSIGNVEYIDLGMSLVSVSIPDEVLISENNWWAVFTAEGSDSCDVDTCIIHNKTYNTAEEVQYISCPIKNEDGEDEDVILQYMEVIAERNPTSEVDEDHLDSIEFTIIDKEKGKLYNGR